MVGGPFYFAGSMLCLLPASFGHIAFIFLPADITRHSTIFLWRLDGLPSYQDAAPGGPRRKRSWYADNEAFRPGEDPAGFGKNDVPAPPRGSAPSPRAAAGNFYRESPHVQDTSDRFHSTYKMTEF